MTVIVAAVLLAVVVLGPLLGRGRQVAGSLGFGESFAISGRCSGCRSPASCWWGGRRCCSPPAPGPDLWRQELPGAVAVAWLTAAVGLRVFVGVAARSSRVFGVLGGALIMLLWLYLLALGLLFNGELNAASGVGARERAGPP